MNRIRQLDRDDLDSLYELRTIAFPGAELDEAEYKRLLSERLPHTRGLFVGRDLACAATVYVSDMHFAGKQLPMGALAGVASAPEHRRGGLVRQLLADDLRVLHEAGVGWCLEYPFDTRFYHRLGWQSVPCGVELDLPCEYLYSGPPPAARRLKSSEFASVEPIYRAWAPRFSFTLTRVDDPRKPWERLVGPHWLDGEGFLYELQGAYVLFTLERPDRSTVLAVEDYAYDGPGDRQDLLAFLGSFHGQVDRVQIHLPTDDALALDYARKYARSERTPLQARIADLGAALAPLTTDVPASFTARVTDPLCPWNDGSFRFQSTAQGTSVTPTSGSVDVELPIQTVPLLLSGAMSARATLSQGLAAGDAGALAVLASLGSNRTPFMPVSDAF